MGKVKNENKGLLTAQQRAELTGLRDQITKTEKQLSLLKELGVGVRDLEEKLIWAKKRSEILLEKG